MTLASSGIARSVSSQCQADEITTASVLAAASGMASPTPRSTAAPPERACSTAAIRGSGSMATTRST